MSLFTIYQNGMKRSACAITVSGLMIIAAGTALAGLKGAVGDLYIADTRLNRIVQVDYYTGEIVCDFVDTGLNNPREARFGPNGNLFVVNGFNNTVTEHDRDTGDFIRTFASTNLNNPTGLRFKSNGNLLVFCVGNGIGDGFINEYDPEGHYIGIFASGFSIYGSLQLDFGPDGNLYVSYNRNAGKGWIERFTPDGTYLGIFTQGGNLKGPGGHTFGGANNNLFVTSTFTSTVLEYNGKTGAYIRSYKSAFFSFPFGIAFGSHGNLWVSNNFGTGNVVEFDGATGKWIRRISEIEGPLGITVKPGPSSDCLNLAVSTLVAGQNATWNIDGATAGSRVTVVNGYQTGKTIINHRRGYCAIFGIDGIDQRRVVGTTIADENGHATIVRKILRNLIGITLLSQAAEKGTCPDECVSNLDTQVIQ